MSIKVQSWVWDNSPYDGVALLIHLALADFASDEGVCWPKQETLARKARCSSRHVRNVVKQMTKDGMLVLEQESNGRLSHRYRVLTPEQGVPAELSSGDA